jgi:hypothetical protein
MSKEVRIVVKAVRRKEPDLRKLARALIELVRLEEEAEHSAGSQNDTHEAAP